MDSEGAGFRVGELIFEVRGLEGGGLSFSR